MASAKILVADAPEAIPLYRKLLMPRYDVQTVTDYQTACQLAAGDIDLVICGVHFDESRMFDFFSAVRRIPRPFICFRGLQTPLAEPALHVIKLAGEVLGSAGFVDFVTLRADFGEDGATEKARQCIEQALKGKTVECD